MSLIKKPIKGSGLVKLRDTATSSDGTTITITETFTGDYAELAIKQASAYLNVKSSSLSPTDAGHGELVLTREQILTSEDQRPESVETIEVLWQELRQPVESAPAFDSLSAEEKRLIKAAAESTDEEPPTLPVSAAPLGGTLYDLLVKGTTEWVTGVPVVRRTTTNVQGNVGGGNAWFRDEPPVTIAGSWAFLKTGDERRKTGRRFDRVEEWTGAKTWDETLYPPL